MSSSTCLHAKFAPQVGRDVQRTAASPTLLNVLTTAGVCVRVCWGGGRSPLAAWNAINLLLLPTQAPVIFHLLLNNFKDMKVINANPGRVSSRWLLCAEGCHFLALYSATHLHGPAGAELNPSQYSNEAHGSEWRYIRTARLPPGRAQKKKKKERKSTVQITFFIIVIYFFDLTAAKVGFQRKKCCC